MNEKYKNNQDINENFENETNKNIFVKIGQGIFSAIKGVVKYTSLIIVRITLGKDAADELRHKMDKNENKNNVKQNYKSVNAQSNKSNKDIESHEENNVEEIENAELIKEMEEEIEGMGYFV